MHCNKRQRIYFCRIGNVPHAGEFATVVSVELRLEKLLLASLYIWPGNMVIMMLTRSFRGKRVYKKLPFFDSMFFNSFDLLSFKILNQKQKNIHSKKCGLDIVFNLFVLLASELERSKLLQKPYTVENQAKLWIT